MILCLFIGVYCTSGSGSCCPATVGALEFQLFILWFVVGTRILQEKLDQPVSAPPSPRDVSMEIDSPENMMRHIRFLKNEVERLKKSLRTTELQRKWPLVPSDGPADDSGCSSPTSPQTV